jgi:two-component sensor histidine kinase
MDDSAHSDRRKTDHVERRVASPWFLPLPRADKSLRPLPEIVLLLDESGRTVSVSDCHAGERLGKVAFNPGATPHESLHAGCDGSDCDFYDNWLRAWRSQELGLPVEWLFHSRSSDALLRLRLQPVGYACSVLYGEALDHFGGHSVLFVQDMSAAVTQLVRSAWCGDEHPNPSAMYELRRSTDPDPNLVYSLDNRLRTITGRLLVSHDVERKRIARELHDSLGQSLSLVRFEIEGCLSRLAASGKNDERESLERTLSLTRRALSELRTITQGLRPSALQDHGLFGTLEVLCDDFRVVCPGIDLTLDLTGCPSQVPDELAIAAYRVVQEGLNNIARHANASKALLQCRSNREGFELTISDDGVGLPAEGATRRGLGLVTMRERTEMLGGNYSITSSPGEGCTVTLRWPTAALESMD